MLRPQYDFDWHHIVDEQSDEAPASTRGRLRLILGLFAVGLTMIFARAVQLEISDGELFRRLAARPLERTVTPSADRGSILARDGTPLAVDRKARALAVEFHYLASPPDPGWLRRLARDRLPRAERRQPERLAAMEETIRGELLEWHRHLAKICKLSDAEWQARAGRIQRRVTALAAHVNARRLDRFRERSAANAPSGELSLTTVVAGLFAPPERLPPPPVVIAEQTAYHRVADDLAPEVVREIEHDSKKHPGAKVVEYTRRDYPLTSLAAHLVGHVGPPGGVDSTAVPSESGHNRELPVGLMGIERSFESALRGENGLETQFTDHRGKWLATTRHRQSVPGRDVVLTIDAQLQLSAEQLLDRSLRRLDRQASESTDAAHGGAIVVLDIHTGEILTAASAPRFDPNWFVSSGPRIEALLHDPRQPLFDRAIKMALPPGSVFKPLTALALLENSVIDPQKPFHCQGYLDDADRFRCQIYRQLGVGHGDVTLADALAQSCNVYFFHHVAQLGSTPLLDWASRFGFGQPTALELPDAAAGHLPPSAQLRQTSQTQAMAIGQGTLTATPLEIARLYAAIANGGHLIAPRLTRDSTDPTTSRASADVELSESTRIAGLSRTALDAVREGLRRVVDDPSGTAFATVHLPTIAIAGKTGTAETGGGLADHSWFAGYVPADAPRLAFVVVLEHAGSGATAAGSVAKNLVQRMQQLGYFGPSPQSEHAIPPGKG
jgi:penicillin-binding protein 2